MGQFSSIPLRTTLVLTHPPWPRRSCAAWLPPSPLAAFLTAVPPVKRVFFFPCCCRGHFPPLWPGGPLTRAATSAPTPERRRLPPKGGRLGGPPARTLPPVLIRLRPFMVPHTAGSGAAAEGAPGPPASPHAHCIGQGLRRAAPCARPPSIQSVLDLSWPAALSFSSRYAADDDAAPSRTSPTPDRCMSPALISSRAVQYAKRQLSVAAPSFCSPLPVQPSSVRPAIDTTKPSRSSPPSAPHLIHCTPCRSYYHHPRTPLVQSVIAFGRGGLSDGFGGPALRWGAASRCARADKRDLCGQSGADRLTNICL